MEINRIDIEKPQEVVWSNTSDGQELGQAVRSFRCTFCKRGFSNAQALGGHMNVHRKDRARLKGSLDGTLFPMDVMKKSPSSDHPPASQDDHDHLLQPESSDDHDKNFAHKRPWIFSEEDEESPRRKDGFKEVLQLPFCVESSSSTNDLGTSSCADGHEGKSIQLRQPSSSSEVDLELRLGPEPKDRS